MYQRTVQQTTLSVSEANAEEVLSELLQKTKPHLIVTEQALMEVPYGDITITYTLRAGKVAKMTITQSKSWLADKNA